MPRYRIELAKSGRSSCRECGKLIDEGTARFGTSDNPPGSRWFHLECAPSGAPRAFKPFAKKAEAFLAKTPAKKGPAKKPAGAPARNAALEAAIIAAPDSREAKLVYADWLQGSGDPWGDLIAYELAGEEKAAKKVLKEHQAELTGGLTPRWFEWEEGVITDAMLDVRNAQQGVERYVELRALRTAAFVRSLRLPCITDAALFEALAKNPLPCLTSLFTWVGPGLETLRSPTVTTLTFCLTQPPRTNLAALFALTRKELPKLTTLELYDGSMPERAIPVAALEQLAASPLLAGLRRLSLTQGALDDAGFDFMVHNAKRFAHLEMINLGRDLDGEDEARAKKAYGAALTSSWED